MKKTISTKANPPRISSTFNLARHLGLSEWTVSRAINGHPEVKASTRERVLKAMDDLGFRPNPVARGLSGKGMGLVGICFSNARNTLMMTKITLLDEFLREHQLRGILAISPQDEASEMRILADFRHLRVDAIVLIQSYLGEAQLREVLEGVACVHLDPGQASLVPRVSLDRGEAMRRIVDHLVDLGHRSFGVLGFSAKNTWRWRGLEEALGRSGLSVKRDVKVFELETPGAESYGEGIQLARRVLEAPPRPTALIAINDMVAAGVMQGIRDQGFRIPEDFSVVGFDNLDVGRHLRPTITTIDQQPHLLIREAGEMLLQLLGKSARPGLNKVIDIEPRLLTRESSGPASPLAAAPMAPSSVRPESS